MYYRTPLNIGRVCDKLEAAGMIATAAYIRRAPAHMIHQRSCLDPFRRQQYARSNRTSELRRIRQKIIYKSDVLNCCKHKGQ